MKVTIDLANAKKRTLLALAKESEDPVVLEYLTTVKNHQVLDRVFCNEHASVEIQKKVVEVYPQVLFYYSHKVSKELIDALDTATKCGLLKNQSSLARLLIDDSDWRVRVASAKSFWIKPEEVEKLASDSYPQVRLAALESGKLSKDTINKMKEDRCLYVSRIAKELAEK